MDGTSWPIIPLRAAVNLDLLTLRLSSPVFALLLP
jgi:hypothetical protein